MKKGNTRIDSATMHRNDVVAARRFGEPEITASPSPGRILNRKPAKAHEAVWSASKGDAAPMQPPVSPPDTQVTEGILEGDFSEAHLHHLADIFESWWIGFEAFREKPADRDSVRIPVTVAFWRGVRAAKELLRSGRRES
jgi:hypothetical protein